jgi:mRNA-degrading endonuclease RelE of RelBE toxin-antitoxin system
MALLIPTKVAKEARKNLPAEEWQRLKERLGRIAQDPHGRHPGVEALEGGGYRVRQGDWRAIYDIDSRGDIEVIKVAHRREVYR